ncbi:MAG: cysteine desulfurase CsdA [Zetaproteobacteria bacterium]|nr:cysteine desulfurase CsdA [Pseudobdellovibrionaceae bacterium]
MTLDIRKIRSDFPILDNKVHGKQLVYLDNGATTLKPKIVTDEINRHYELEASNVHRGVHFHSENATLKYEAARRSFVRFLNARSENEIIFTSGTTASINLVAQSWGRNFLKQGDEIIISWLEHHSNIVPWQMLCEEKGCVLKVVPINKSGEVDVEAYKDLLSSKTKLVAMTWVSNAIGTIVPIKEVIDLAQQVGAITVVDGAQGSGHFNTDVQELGCDFFALSGHKLFGATGTGILYGKEELLEKMPPVTGGGSMIRIVTFEKTTWAGLPDKFEAGTPHIGGVIGMAKAIEYLHNIGFDDIQKWEHELLLYGTEKLSSVPKLTMIGTAENKAPIFSFVIDGIHPHDMGTLLDQEGVAIRAGHHCCQPLMKFYGVPATSRASLAFYNTKEDIDALVNAIAKAQEIFA